jgi:hypothetical protein
LEERENSDESFQDTQFESGEQETGGKRPNWIPRTAPGAPRKHQERSHKGYRYQGEEGEFTLQARNGVYRPSLAIRHFYRFVRAFETEIETGKNEKWFRSMRSQFTSKTCWAVQETHYWSCIRV